MSITLEHFIGTMQNCQMTCIAGFKGLQNELSSFSIIDTPEIISWLNGGELVVEAGYITKNHPELSKNLIKDLANKGCAGLGIKLNRYYEKIPDHFITQANLYNFPVFELPYETKFCDLSFEIYKQIFKDKMNTEEKIHTLYNKLIKNIFNDVSIEHILYDITTAILNPILLIDKDFRLLNYEIPSENTVNLSEIMNMEFNRPILETTITHNLFSFYRKTHFKTHSIKIDHAGSPMKIIFASISKDDYVEAFIVIPETITKLTEEHYKILESIISIVGIGISKQNSNSQNLRYWSNDFVNNVLMNPSPSDANIKYYCETCGFDYSLKRICMNIVLDDFIQLSYDRKSTIHNIISSFKSTISKNYNLKYYFSLFNNNFVFFFMFSKSQENKACYEIVEEIANKLCDIFIKCNISAKAGISNSYTQINKIPEAFKQTIDMIFVGKNLIKTKIYTVIDTFKSIICFPHQ